jgi:hypothetical protein
MRVFRMDHPTPREFRESHKNLADTNAGNEMDAAKIIAEDLKRITKGMSLAEKKKYFQALAEDSARHPEDYANFKIEDGHLHVITRGFACPIINFGMSKDTDLEDKMRQVSSPRIDELLNPGEHVPPSDS